MEAYIFRARFFSEFVILRVRRISKIASEPSVHTFTRRGKLNKTQTIATVLFWVHDSGMVDDAAYSGRKAGLYSYDRENARINTLHWHRKL
jgi:hypothetical protein